MTNHPHHGRSDWYKSAGGLANEYAIGIATHANHARQYANPGYERIDRELRILRDRLARERLGLHELEPDLRMLLEVRWAHCG